MELVIKGKNFPVTEAVRDYLQRRLSKLSRHLNDIGEAKVELAMESTRSQQDRHVVQVTLAHKGTILRAEERSPDVFTAIDRVAEALDRQVLRYKSKLYERGGRDTLRQGAEVASPAAEPERLVVKTKRFPVHPMSVAQAAEQMELLGHDFFLFYDAEDKEYRLLYRRDDGDYGLIQPELAP